MDFTFLKEDQIWGDGALYVMKRYGTKVAPTDLTAILGGVMDRAGGAKTSEGETTCASWSASSNEDEDVRCVIYEGDQYWTDTGIRTISARPALNLLSSSLILHLFWVFVDSTYMITVQNKLYHRYPESARKIPSGMGDVLSENLKQGYEIRTKHLLYKYETGDK